MQAHAVAEARLQAPARQSAVAVGLLGLPSRCLLFWRWSLPWWLQRKFARMDPRLVKVQNFPASWLQVAAVAEQVTSSEG